MSSGTTDTQTVVAIDFDGTITERDAYPDGPTPIRQEAKALIDELHSQGCWVVLWTCREGEALDEALSMCENVGIRFDSVNEGNGRRGDSRKINADIYIDDKSARTLREAVDHFLPKH